MTTLLKRADEREAVMVDNLVAIRGALEDIKMDAQANWAAVNSSLSKLSKIGMAILKAERLTSTGIQQFSKAGKELHEDQKKVADSRKSDSEELERREHRNQST